MNEPSRPARRSFLRQSFVLVPATVTLAGAGTVVAQNTGAPPAAPAASAAATPYTPTYFNAEWVAQCFGDCTAAQGKIDALIGSGSAGAAR